MLNSLARRVKLCLKTLLQEPTARDCGHLADEYPEEYQMAREAGLVRKDALPSERLKRMKLRRLALALVLPCVLFSRAYAGITFHCTDPAACVYVRYIDAKSETPYMRVNSLQIGKDNIIVNHEQGIIGRPLSGPGVFSVYNSWVKLTFVCGTQILQIIMPPDDVLSIARYISYTNVHYYMGR